jgi:hypothetical protein
VKRRRAGAAGRLVPVSFRIWACNACILHLVVARVCAGVKIVGSATGSKSIDGVPPAGRPSEARERGKVGHCPSPDTSVQGARNCDPAGKRVLADHGRSRILMFKSLTPAGGDALRAGTRQQAFALSRLTRGFSASADGLALLSRSTLGRLFIRAPAFHLAKQAFALELLLQDPQGLFDIIFANKDFQSGLLSV